MKSRHRRRSDKSAPPAQAEEAPRTAAQADDRLPKMSVMDMREWVADNDPLAVFAQEVPDELPAEPGPSERPSRSVKEEPSAPQQWIDSAVELAQYARRRSERFRRELPSLGRQLRREYGATLGLVGLAVVALSTLAVLNSLREMTAPGSDPKLPPALAKNTAATSVPPLPSQGASVAKSRPADPVADAVDPPPAPAIVRSESTLPAADQRNRREIARPVEERLPPANSQQAPRQAAVDRPASQPSAALSPPPPTVQPQAQSAPAPRTAANDLATRETESSLAAAPRPAATGGVVVAEPAPAAPPVAPPASAPVVAPPVAAAVPPSASPARVVPQTAAIESVLDRYEIAFSMLDARRAKAVWPTVNERNLERAFDSLENQTFDLGECDIDVAASSAVASCQGTARYTPKVGSRKVRTERRQWTFHLQQRGQDWSIESVNSR